MGIVYTVEDEKTRRLCRPGRARKGHLQISELIRLVAATEVWQQAGWPSFWLADSLVASGICHNADE